MIGRGGGGGGGSLRSDAWSGGGAVGWVSSPRAAWGSRRRDCSSGGIDGGAVSPRAWGGGPGGRLIGGIEGGGEKEGPRYAPMSCVAASSREAPLSVGGAGRAGGGVGLRGAGAGAGASLAP